MFLQPYPIAPPDPALPPNPFQDVRRRELASQAQFGATPEGMMPDTPPPVLPPGPQPASPTFAFPKWDAPPAPPAPPTATDTYLRQLQAKPGSPEGAPIAPGTPGGPSIPWYKKIGAAALGATGAISSALAQTRTGRPSIAPEQIAGAQQGILQGDFPARQAQYAQGLKQAGTAAAQEQSVTKEQSAQALQSAQANYYNANAQTKAERMVPTPAGLREFINVPEVPMDIAAAWAQEKLKSSKPPDLSMDEQAYAEWAKSTDPSIDRTKYPTNQMGYMNYKQDRPGMANAKYTEALAQSLAKGDATRIRDVMSLRSGTGGASAALAVFGRAKEINPAFSTGWIDRRIKLLEDYTGSGKTAQNLQSFGTFLQHTSAALGIVQDVKLTDAQLFNRPMNWIRTHATGDPKYAALITALEPVKKEYEGFLLNNRALYQEDRISADKILSDNASPAMYLSAMQQMAHTAKARFDEANFRYKREFHEDIPEPFSPEAIEAARKFGVELQPGTEGETPVSPRAPSVRPGVIKLDLGPNGKLRIAPITKPVTKPTAAPSHSSAPSSTAALDIPSLVRQEAVKQGVDPDLALRVANAESGLRTDAVSSKGALGPMQLMPATAQSLGVDPNDPAQNIAGGVTYLKQMLDMFGGDTEKALAAYNAGPGAVKKYGGIPPFSETQNYVSKIMPERSFPVWQRGGR